MEKPAKKFTIGGELWRRFGELILAVAIIVGIVYFWKFIQVKRVDIQSQRQQQEAGPNQQIAEQQLKDVLQQHDHDLQRVQALLLPRSDIGAFVTELEIAAKLGQLQLEVPTIAEDQKLDENHQPIPQTGPYVDVRLQLVAAGDPIQLIQFMHRLENLPYVVRVVEWQLHTLQANEIPTLSQVAPVTGPSGGVPPTITPQPPNQLMATLILTMRQEGTHE